MTIFLKGILIGFVSLAIPGLGASTIAIILGIYYQMISSISSIFKDFKKNALFLIVLILGYCVGGLIGSLIVDTAYNLYPCGTGNDFYHDIVGEEYKENILLNPYLENLPVIEVKCTDSDTKIKKKFINGIGYGIDGYCCEVGDKLRKITTKPINYTSIAIKGLLFHSKPVKAKVIVDGKVSEMKHVWLAPTMKGRFYGGGMKVAPNQDRFSGLVTTVTYKTFNKLKALIVFPSIFKGEHLKYKKIVSVYEGKEAEVVFNRPTALQIDGETISNVISYKVHA